MAESLAVRLGDLGLTRATEQTALLLALLAAQGKKHNRQWGDRFALASMLGYLSHTHCIGRVVHRDPKYVEPLRLWSSFFSSRPHPAPANAELFGIAPPPRQGDPPVWDLDVILGPVDGMRALWLGDSHGTVSVLGGGAPDAFVQSTAHVALDYFVLVVKEPLVPDMTTLLARAEEDRVFAAAVPAANEGPPVDPAGAPNLEQLIRYSLDFMRRQPAAARPMTWCTAVNPPDYAGSFIRDELLGRFKTSAFGGSSVAAGIAALLPQSGISGFVGIVRRTHVLLLAIAACATGGALIAIPIREVAKAPQAFGIDFEKPTFRETHLIRTDAGASDVFLVVTGVTDTYILRGVRFFDDATVSTNTLCLRSKTRARRFIEHTHDLHRKPFRLLSRDRFEWPIIRDALTRFAGDDPESRTRFARA